MNEKNPPAQRNCSIHKFRFRDGVMLEFMFEVNT